MTKDDCEERQLPIQCELRFKTIDEKLDALLAGQKSMSRRAWEILKGLVLLVVGFLLASVRNGK